MKLAYADKAAFLGDPDAVEVPEEVLISKEYAGQRRGAIALDSALPQGTPRGSPLNDSQRSTTHLCVLDDAGWRVSFSSTLTSLFGAAIVIPGSGFPLNNTLTAFNRTGTGPNAPASMKRAASPTCPFVVNRADGTPALIGGAAGGNRIPAILFSIVSGILDHGLSPQDAVSAPRIVNENRMTGTDVSGTRMEPAPFAAADALVSSLRSRGQTVTGNTLPFGVAQVIAVDAVNGRLRRGVDPRRGGDF
jgi:gamma-glutamyltranspeptidase/glutathione hydrolase